MCTINNEIISCPHCKSNNIWKFGTYNDRPRFRCKDCLKTFTKSTNEPWSYSKKSIDLWHKYIKLMKYKMTLRECAKELNISLYTAFGWRHKLLDKINNKYKGNKLFDEVSIMKSKILENRKGQRNLTTPQREMHFSYAIDTKTNFLIDIYYGIISVKMYDEIFKKHVSKSAKILRTNNRIINISSEKFNKFKIEKKGFSVFWQFAKYKAWLTDFRGIATHFQTKYHHYFNNMKNMELVLNS